MKTKFNVGEGRAPRTSGWKTQWDFDNLLARLDVSSLCFLNDKYKYDIREYPQFHDLNHPDYQQEYKEMLQRKHMITEEIDVRIMEEGENKEYFDTETGCVLDRYGTVEYSVAYSEDEDSIIYTHNMNEAETPIEEDDETDYEYYKYHDRKEMYRLWNYTEQLDEATA